MFLRLWNAKSTFLSSQCGLTAAQVPLKAGGAPALEDVMAEQLSELWSQTILGFSLRFVTLGFNCISVFASVKWRQSSEGQEGLNEIAYI